MYDDRPTLSERVEFLEDELAQLKQIVKVSFTGTANELDELEMNQGRHQKHLGKLTKILDVHFDIIKKIDRKER